jgi:hypothetical protein
MQSYEKEQSGQGRGNCALFAVKRKRLPRWLEFTALSYLFELCNLGPHEPELLY